MKTFKFYLPLAIIIGMLGFNVNAFANDVTVNQSNLDSPQLTPLEQSGIIGAPINHTGVAQGNVLPYIDANPGFLDFLDNGGIEQNNRDSAGTVSDQETNHLLYSSIVQDVSTTQESIGNSTSISAVNQLLTMGEGGGMEYDQRNENTSQFSALALGRDSVVLGGGDVTGLIAETIPVANVTAKGNVFFSESLSFAGDVTQLNTGEGGVAPTVSSQKAQIDFQSVVLTQPGVVAPSATSVGNEAITLFNVTLDDNSLTQTNEESTQGSSILVENSAAFFVLDHDADANATGNFAMSGSHLLNIGTITQSNGFANFDPVQTAAVTYDKVVTNGGFTIDANAVGNDLLTDQAALSDVVWTQTNTGMGAGPDEGEVVRVNVLSVVNGAAGHNTKANAIGNRTTSFVDLGLADISIAQTNTEVAQGATVTYTGVVSAGTIAVTESTIGNTYTVNP